MDVGVDARALFCETRCFNWTFLQIHMWIPRQGEADEVVEWVAEPAGDILPVLAALLAVFIHIVNDLVRSSLKLIHLHSA